MTDKKAKGHEYVNHSRGYKTKGASYKDRYVDRECPDCKHTRAYKDTWKTRVAYTCLKRSCRFKWYEALTPEEMKENAALLLIVREAEARARAEAESEEVAE